MYLLHEALAREHMRQLERDAELRRQARLAAQVAAAQRWARLAGRVEAVAARHAQRAAARLAPLG